MSFFDMLGYLVMAPLLDYFGRVKTLTGAYSITGGSIIISSLITYFFPDVAFLGTVCRVLGKHQTLAPYSLATLVVWN